MRFKDSKLVVLTVLAIAFTLGLTYATIEAPKLVSILLSPLFPDHGVDVQLIEEMMVYMRPIGYVCLVLVIALIFIGFKTDRADLSSLGSIALFLPTFGYFALSMFFLAGIGVLRVLWMPFWDFNISLLKLGDIAYVPYMILVYPFSLIGMDIRTPLSYLAIGVGLLLFILGTVTWFYGKSEKIDVIDFWIYRYSRHSQYLGYIIWSYGVMLLASLSPVPFGGTPETPSFPWLISTLLVICVALAEEKEMAKKFKGKYVDYNSKTPFMLYLPNVISSFVTAPVRIIFKKDHPETGSEIIGIFVIYLVIFILLSLPFIILNWPPGLGWSTWPSFMPPSPTPPPSQPH